MNYIVITDIFGNKISKDDNKKNYLPFILLHTSQPHLLMERVKNDKNLNVWKLVFPTIMHVLYLNRFNPNKFAPLGHIWYPQNKLPNNDSILLVNVDKNISQYPVRYVNVRSFDEYSLWKPIAPRGFRAIGYILSKREPSKYIMRTINNSLVTLFRKKIKTINSLTNMNEFKLLSFYGDKKYTIDRTKLLDKNRIVRLVSKKTGEYVTKVDNDLVMENNKNDNQIINYTTQGKLKLNGKCIGISGNDTSSLDLSNNLVKIQDCDESDGQKWFPYRSHFVSQYDGSCLSVDNNSNGSGNSKLVNDDCQDKIDQEWMTESLETVIENQIQEDNESWRTRHGKKVILLQPDNPWFIDRGQKLEPVGIVKTNIKKLNEVSYRDNADFNSQFMMDVRTPSMGYGYSLADREGKPCSCLDDCNRKGNDEFVFENFTQDNDNNGYSFNTIACVLITFVAILAILRYYKK